MIFFQLLSKESGNGTTLVTILIAGDSLMSQTAQKVTNELATAERIKSKDTRHAVTSALRSVKAKLASLSNHHAPKNGIAIYASEKDCTMLGDLPGRIKSPLYRFCKEKERRCSSLFFFFFFEKRCDSHFHTSVLEEMLHDGPTFGYIVFDGSGCTIATVNSSIRILGELTAHLPKKHGKGGQSAPRLK
jgi:peptide subunit release factor 1 (eRF1)